MNEPKEIMMNYELELGGMTEWGYIIVMWVCCFVIGCILAIAVDSWQREKG